MKSYLKRILFLSIFLFVGCANGQSSLEIAFPNLSFTRPVDFQHAGNNSNRLFVVEQRGVIWIFENDSAVIQKSIFLDIKDRVNDSGNEEGLLGLAFHPEYENNGYFYVNYTASHPRRTVISRFMVSANNPNDAMADSEYVLLEINQPYSNHNGGQIVFGPDGYLYIGMGDGGSGGDPDNNGQDLTTLLGAMLRIDVNTNQGSLNYAIPMDNPFVNNTMQYREEIYAYGLRNPWRFSFDPITGWLWLADVGQNRFEEIDIIQSGGNYGWRIMEGYNCYDPANSCDTTGLIMPIWEYDHSLGQSITGGYVYRGTLIPEFVGKYIYADFISGNIWSIEYDGQNSPINNLIIDSNLLISSFGVDENNELYICSFDGKIYRFKPTVTGNGQTNGNNIPKTFQVGQNYPNPFNPKTTIPLTLNETSKVKIIIYNTEGKKVRTLIDTTYNSGSYLIPWNGMGINDSLQPSGIYYYQLHLNDRLTSTRRMVLLK